AARQERSHIFHTLTQFADPTTNRSRFEIVLYLNLVETGPANDPERAFIAIEAEIDRFRLEHPRLSVRTVRGVYHGGVPTIGMIRADMWNAIGIDLLRRGRARDVLVLSADADTIGLSPGFLDKLIGSFERTGTEVITARWKWQLVPEQSRLVNRI